MAELPKAQRPRFSGSPRELADVLSPIVNGRGRSFIKYDDNDHVAKSSMDGEAIIQAADILDCLREAAGETLLFSKSTLKDCNVDFPLIGQDNQRQ